MKDRVRGVARSAVAVAAAVALVAGVDALSTPTAEAGLIGLPGGPFACPDLWAPVVCENGQVYSNYCYARLAGQTDCVPFGIY